MGLLEFYIIVNVAFLLVALCSWLDYDAKLFSIVNPKVIYNNTEFNWLGAIIITISLNLLLPVVAVPYWIYKLMTVGRKDT